MDENLVEKLNERFSQKLDTAPVSKIDILFLLGIFKSRWDQSIDGEGDYTLYPEKLYNAKWIQLAKELAPLACFSTYLKVLFPSINDRDCNRGSALSGDLSPGDLYDTGTGKSNHKSANSSTFYTRAGLLEHIQKGHKLSTLRDHKLSSAEPSALTVHELCRLMSTKYTREPFWVDAKEYGNIWDFFVQKVFPQYKFKGTQSWNLLGHLSLLLSTYARCRINRNNFAIFEAEVSLFLNFILCFELDDINNFYLLKISDRSGIDRYMFEFLKELSCASSYESVEGSIIRVVGWLATLHRALIPEIFSSNCAAAKVTFKPQRTGTYIKKAS